MATRAFCLTFLAMLCASTLISCSGEEPKGAAKVRGPLASTYALDAEATLRELLTRGIREWEPYIVANGGDPETVRAEVRRLATDAYAESAHVIDLTDDRKFRWTVSGREGTAPVVTTGAAHFIHPDLVLVPDRLQRHGTAQRVTPVSVWVLDERSGRLHHQPCYMWMGYDSTAELIPSLLIPRYMVLAPCGDS